MNGDPFLAQGATVLIVNRVGFLGGAERIMLNCAAGVRQHGFRPVLACPLGGNLVAAAGELGIETASI